ncbi:Binding-protein-dependent transporter, inner membrane component (plasmid) [Sodalis praecaptivus]|uniref:Binding-protein-dependent transporter, inner membrane component n=1 Tax=Sodalis praecaptivus TaxID=1239307 RepID=W0I363_9GAMM|nr:ABC transporter permease [Sodalis praecaptivus]AHF79197.1 Binding-protein-dependent transporter, inner membrane component [Sodalis praecaptivus]
MTTMTLRPARSLFAGLGRAKRSPSLLIGLALLVAIIVCALLAPWLFPDDPREMVGAPNQWPGSAAGFPLGTDMMGRDVMAQLFYGARASLAIGLIATALALIAGVVIGVIAGYYAPSWIDDVLMRFTEVFLTMPRLLFAIAIILVMGPTLFSLSLALGATSWPQIARLVRAEAMKIREQDFIRAAATIGIGDRRIIFRHVLPNSVTPVMVASSVLIAQIILSEASLSFLGLGDPSLVSWGAMVGAGREVLRTAWYMAALPGLAIFFTVMSFMLIGNGLNDLFNPRLTES